MSDQESVLHEFQVLMQSWFRCFTDSYFVVLFKPTFYSCFVFFCNTCTAKTCGICNLFLPLLAEKTESKRGSISPQTTVFHTWSLPVIYMSAFGVSLLSSVSLLYSLSVTLTIFLYSSKRLSAKLYTGFWVALKISLVSAFLFHFALTLLSLVSTIFSVFSSAL